MAQGIFNLKQVMQAIQQDGWNVPGNSRTFAGLFNGSTQFLSMPSISAYTLNADFTIEFFANATSYPSTGGGSPCPLSSTNSSNNWLVLVDTGAIAFYWNGSAVLTVTPSNIIGEWFHVAVVRSGSTVTIYKNGVSLGTATNSSSFTSTSTMRIGQQNTGVGYWAGSLSNVRIVKGTAVYTSNFTPPTSALTAITNTSLLTLQNDTIIDNSTNAAIITNNNSVSFNATNPFPQRNKTPAVEFLVVAGGGGGGGSYEGAGGGAGGLLQGLDPVPNNQTLLVTVGAGGTGGSAHSVTVTNTNGANSVFGSITAIGGGKGGSAEPASPLTVLNGSAGGSGGGGSRWSTTYGFGQPGAGIAGQGNSGGRSNASSGGTGGGGGAGAIGSNSFADVLAGNGGVGVASGISGTVTAYAGGGGGDSGSVRGLGGVGGGGDYESAGTANRGGGGGGSRSSGNGGAGGSGIVILSYPDIYATPSSTTGLPTATTSGSGSVSFTGSGSAGAHLSYPHSSALQFGSGAFTIECWGLFRGTHEHAILARAPFDGTNNEWIFSIGATLYPTFNYSPTGSNSTNALAGSTAVALNTWYHIAVVRNSNTLTMYLNGTSVGTASITGSIYSSGTCTTTFGSYAHIGVSTNGYAVGNCLLSNVRAVKGTAVYTSNFTPSTIPLTAISGTGFLNNTVSGSHTTDSSTNTFKPSAPSSSGIPPWDAGSPFTVTGYKNRVYSFTSSGTITF